MPYDTDLGDRLRELLAGRPDVVEKKMFGGLAFLVGGHMVVSASGQGGLLVRVDPAQSEALLIEPHSGPFVMRGREMPGWLRVDLDATAADDDLRPWVDRALAYVDSLPPK